MAGMEQTELDAHRNQIITDVRELVEKYRAIFDWDVPDIDQHVADRLIIAAIRRAMDDIEVGLLSANGGGKIRV